MNTDTSIEQQKRDPKQYYQLIERFPRKINRNMDLSFLAVSYGITMSSIFLYFGAFRNLSDRQRMLFLGSAWLLSHSLLRKKIYWTDAIALIESNQVVYEPINEDPLA